MINWLDSKIFSVFEFVFASLCLFGIIVVVWVKKEEYKVMYEICSKMNLNK